MTSVSKKQRKFLTSFLRLKSLEDLLPLYTAAVSGNTLLFDTLPDDLINPVRDSLRNFQRTVGEHDSKAPATFATDFILRRLQNLDGKGLLANYVESLTRGSVSYAQIPEDIRTSAEWWLDELRSCITGKNGLFSNEFDPEVYVDGFVEFAGGNRIANILGSNIPSDNADYFFKQDNVIAELKILETDFWESNKEKLEVARAEALKTVEVTRDMISGTGEGYPEEVFWAEFRVLRDALQRVTKKANEQIKNSKQLLDAPEAKGIVIFLIDGFYSINPFLTIELLHDPLTRQFSGVDAFIFLNFRRKVTLDLGDGPYDYFVFEPRYRPDYPESLPKFIDKFGSRWFEYMQRLAAKSFSKHIISRDSQNLMGAVWK